MGHVLASVITGIATALGAFEKPMRRANTLLRVSQALHQRHESAGITFVSTHPQALDYPFQLLTREPGTIKWLNGMSPGDVLWDIGANVGAYSLYAAKRGVRVVAFEPAPASFAALCVNIRANQLHEKITPLPIALGKSNGLGKLFMPHANPGSVGNSLGSGGIRCLASTADDCRRVLDLPYPTHIKIDVDGAELDILDGARETVAHVTSLLVEIEDAEPVVRRTGLRHVSSQDGNAIFER